MVTFEYYIHWAISYVEILNISKTRNHKITILLWVRHGWSHMQIVPVIGRDIQRLWMDGGDQIILYWISTTVASQQQNLSRAKGADHT